MHSVPPQPPSPAPTMVTSVVTIAVGVRGMQILASHSDRAEEPARLADAVPPGTPRSKSRRRVRATARAGRRRLGALAQLATDPMSACAPHGGN